MIPPRKLMIGAGLSVPTALAGAWLAWSGAYGRSPAALAQAQPPVPPTVVVARPTTREIVEKREFAGRFEPSAAVEIRARVAGHLASIDFEDGALVEQGQLLFTIDPRPYRAALEEAQARLASAEAQVELANLELARSEQLASTNAVSKSTLDQRRQQMKAANAARDIAQAEVSRAQIDLGFTQVRAPFAGRVSNRRLDLGALVADGAMLTTLVAVHAIYFVFDVSEQDMLAYRQAAASRAVPSLEAGGIAVELRDQATSDWRFSGTLDFVDNRLEAGAGTIRARAVVSNADGALVPGQFGRVRLPFSGSYPAVMVPEAALMTDQADRAVLTVAGDGTVRAAKVRLGPRQEDGLRVVRSGIGPDERVVVSGQLRARPGQKVTVQDAEPEPRSARLGTAATN